MRNAANWEGAMEIADDPDSIRYGGVTDRSDFQQAWPMSRHSRIYQVRSHGRKQDTEDKVEVSIGAYFLKSLDRELHCIIRCSCIHEREQRRLVGTPGLRVVPMACKHKCGVLMKTHRAFRARSAFQASPVLAIQNALPPAPKPPKPPPVTALVPFNPKAPPKALLDKQSRVQLDSDGLIKCQGGLRAKPYANDGYIPPLDIYSLTPKPQSALHVLMATPEFADCAIGGTVVGLFPARQAHMMAAALLSEPKDHVCMTAFTFGEEDSGGPIVVGLGRATRFVSVRILADERETLKGKTKRQALCL